jgi:hypothetical protein
MPDNRELFMEDLESARYLANSEETVAPEFEQPAGRVKPRRSGAEQTIRLLSVFVFVFMLAAAGGLYWQNRESIASGAKNFKKHSTCGVDLLLWAGGSKKTFSEGLSDRIKKAQQDSDYQFDQIKSPFKTEFEHNDFQSMSNAWNGGAASRGRRP